MQPDEYDFADTDCSPSRRWIVAALAGVFALAVGMGLKAAGVWG